MDAMTSGFWLSRWIGTIGKSRSPRNCRTFSWRCGRRTLHFSLFQSVPDSGPLISFPDSTYPAAQPEPDVMASIADITCDSDGEITSFVGENGRTKFLPLHKIRKDEDYYIGFFLIGAYQEILGICTICLVIRMRCILRSTKRLIIRSIRL